MNSHQYIIFFRKNKAKMINNRGTRTVLSFDNPKPKMHPSEKSVAMLEVLIENSSKGETVLDFTMRSASTGIAALNTGRKFIGIEKDKKYFDMAEQRMNNHFENLISKEKK